MRKCARSQRWEGAGRRDSDVLRRFLCFTRFFSRLFSSWCLSFSSSSDPRSSSCGLAESLAPGLPSAATPPFTLVGDISRADPGVYWYVEA
jgi:hypothetical protein